MKAKINFNKFNQIVTQESENSVLYPSVCPKTEELNNPKEVPVRIIQFSLQKLYIQQEIFLFGYETTKLIREKKKKRRELKRTNGEQLKLLIKEVKFLQREIKRSMKRSEKIKQSKLIASAQNKVSKSIWRAVKVLKSHINKSEQKQTLRNAKY